MGPFSYHDGCIVCGQGTAGRVHVLWYFDIRPHRVRTACPNSAVSPLCVCCGHYTLEKRLLKTLYTGEEALLEKRP